MEKIELRFGLLTEIIELSSDNYISKVAYPLSFFDTPKVSVNNCFVSDNNCNDFTDELMFSKFSHVLFCDTRLRNKDGLRVFKLSEISLHG